MVVRFNVIAMKILVILLKVWSGSTLFFAFFRIPNKNFLRFNIAVWKALGFLLKD